MIFLTCLLVCLVISGSLRPQNRLSMRYRGIPVEYGRVGEGLLAEIKKNSAASRHRVPRLSKTKG